MAATLVSQAFSFHKEDDAMAETMSPSKVTDGQVHKLQEMFGAGVRKAEPELPSSAIQEAMENQGDALVSDVVKVVRKYAEMFVNIIVRVVQVNRNRKPQEAIRATDRREYLSSEVVANMPQGEGEKAEVVFFKLGRFVSDNNLEREYELHGLKPADPYSLAAVNEADVAFADDCPNATHWKDSNGRWCYAAFRRWSGERGVSVSRCDHDWGDDWWFAGLRK